MGASLSWFAFRGKTPEAVLRDLGLKSVGKEYRETPFCGGVLPSGWFLVIQGRHEFGNDEVRRLSRGCEVIVCFVEERVGVSRAAAWRDGKQIWCVTHDIQEGDDEHLEVEGELPASFNAIRDRLTKQQEQVGGADFISDIPLDLAKEITGYSHDERPAITFDNFVRSTFLQRVFGR